MSSNGRVCPGSLQFGECLPVKSVLFPQEILLLHLPQHLLIFDLRSSMYNLLAYFFVPLQRATPTVGKPNTNHKMLRLSNCMQMLVENQRMTFRLLTCTSQSTRSCSVNFSLLLTLLSSSIAASKIGFD